MNIFRSFAVVFFTLLCGVPLLASELNCVGFGSINFLKVENEEKIKKCLVQVSYAIGVAKPTSIMVDSFGTAKLSDEELSKIVMENFDLRPKGIVNMLDLLRPIYRKTAAYGHFGRTEPEFSWEKIDKKDLT